MTRRSHLERARHLVNGAFSLAQPLRVELSKATWTGPVSNDVVDVGVQAVDRGE